MEFDTQIELLLLSDPRCRPCSRLLLCTCGRLIEEPRQLHSRNLCDCSISSLESRVFYIDGKVPWVDHGHIVRFHLDTRKKSCIGLFPIPRQFQNGSPSISFILNRGMLQIPNVELPHTAISSDGGENIALSGEVNIIHLFIMSDQLGKNSWFFNIPNGAGSVDWGSSDEVVELRVPVERSERGWEVVVLDMNGGTFLRLS